MGFSLTTAYPFWFFIICIACGVGYACILYYSNTNNGFGKTFNALLFVLRLLAVTIISFLLLSPLLKTVSRHVEKPIIVLALDNSESIAVGKDSSYFRNEFTPSFRELANKLSSKYEIATYSFDKDVTPGLKGDFHGKQTDMSKLFSELNNRYSNRNLAAVVLAGDGIVTRGADPIYTVEKVPYSIYTIALGDTSRHRDLLVARVNYNHLAYLGNNFPIEITILGYKCTGSQSRLSVVSGDKQIYSEAFNVANENFTKTVNVMVSATVSGIQRFRISVAPVKGEISVQNNFRDIFVEVLDGRQKVLLVSASPHPDIAALKEAIENNRNYEVEQVQLDQFSGNVNKYSLVILHQVPSILDAGSQLLTQLKGAKVPVLFILGSQSNLQAFNALQMGLNIPPTSASLSAAFPQINPNFSQFSISSEVSRMISEYPPLNVPFGQYKSVTSSEPLLYQRIGSVSTSMPLISFNQGLDRKSGIIAGEGIWRWRLTDYLKSGNHQAFDELMSRVVQYLSVKSDKSQFRVILKNNFTEDETVEIDAELYNDSYELVNEPDVNIVVTDKSGKTFPFSFSRTVNAYYLNAGSFPPGEYTYKASTSYSGKSFQKTGSFVVMAINEELLNTVANHNLLFTLAGQHNGEMLHPSDMNKLIDILNKREDIKTVTYAQKKYTDLVNIFWVFLLIISLLSAEWFLRKRSGGY
ncbi:MAG: hypothetical protein HXX13_03870 [Bacteroidetes bacterium]|nr:hypothetical protein [Bacteroidota bacterium]